MKSYTVVVHTKKRDQKDTFQNYKQAHQLFLNECETLDIIFSPEIRGEVSLTAENGENTVDLIVVDAE